MVFIAGAGPYRATDPVTTATARLLAEAGVQSTVHDRLGRGESRVDGPIDLDREIDALTALVERVGGRAVLVGHSSGCSIALAAAVRGAPATALALHETPLTDDGATTADWWSRCAAAIAAGELERALETYMEDMPPELLADIRIPVVATVGAETFPGMPEAADAIARATGGRAITVAGAWHSREPAAMAELLAGLAHENA